MTDRFADGGAADYLSVIQTKLVNCAEPEVFPGGEIRQKLRIASGFRTEPPVTADTDPADVNASVKNGPGQKIARRKGGEFAGERHRHNGFDAVTPQQTDLFVRGVKQLRRTIRQ